MTTRGVSHHARLATVYGKLNLLGFGTQVPPRPKRGGVSGPRFGVASVSGGRARSPSDGAVVMSMSSEELLSLPAVVDLPTAADVLGIGHSSAYELVRTGQWPTPVLRLGRLIRVPSAPLLALVGVERPTRQAS